MSKLQKSACINLIIVTIGVIVGGAGFYFLVFLNTKGIDFLLTFFIVGSLTILGTYMFYRKKGPEAGFDEREKRIDERAFSFAAMSLTVFLACVCIIPFFVLGGRNVIKVYYLPLIFLSTLFTAQFVHSMAILIQCSLEEEDGQ